MVSRRTGIALRQCLGCTDDVNWGMIARWNPELDIAAAFQKYCAFCKDVRVNYEKIYRPYVQALIDQCRRCGILTALASSSPMDNIQTVLCDCQLEGQFDLVVSGCDLPSASRIRRSFCNVQSSWLACQRNVS